MYILYAYIYIYAYTYTYIHSAKGEKKQEGRPSLLTKERSEGGCNACIPVTGHSLPFPFATSGERPR